MLLCYKLIVSGDKGEGVIYYQISDRMIDANDFIMEVREQIKRGDYVPSDLFSLVSGETEERPLICIRIGFMAYDNPQDTQRALEHLLASFADDPKLDYKDCINLVEIKEQMRRLRYLLTVHSGLYYDHNVNVISDDDWDEKARQLVELQARYPGMVDKVQFFDDIFRDFTGDTGMHLPWRDPGIADKIYSLGKQWGVL